MRINAITTGNICTCLSVILTNKYFSSQGKSSKLKPDKPVVRKVFGILLYVHAFIYHLCDN